LGFPKDNPALFKMGIEWVDVAGRGGTSWSRIEAQRITDPYRKKLAEEFTNGVIPTAAALIALSKCGTQCDSIGWD
jgi:isopentenyl-diphosphate delta-isomerase